MSKYKNVNFWTLERIAVGLIRLILWLTFVLCVIYILIYKIIGLYQSPSPKNLFFFVEIPSCCKGQIRVLFIQNCCVGKRI